MALVMPASVDQDHLIYLDLCVSVCVREAGVGARGFRHAVPNLRGSSVNPKCLEKRSSEHPEGFDRQLYQADGWLWGPVHTRVLPFLPLSWKLGGLSYSRQPLWEGVTC